MKNIMDLICRTSVRRSVGLALAVVIVFTTTYSLVLPALTITEDDATEDAGFYSSETVVSQEPEGSSESSASSSDSVSESESAGDSETSQASEPVASESDEETAQSESPQESAQEPSEDTQVSQVQESEHSHHQDADTSDAEEIDDVEDVSQAEEVQETDEAEDEDVPQFLSFEAQADDWVGGQREVMQVYVEADPGAFPKGTTMEVATVTDQKVIDTISQAVKGDVKTVHAVDITFHNRWGKEIEPAQGAQVRVTMSSNVVAAWSDPTVVHYTEEKGWFGRIKSTDVEIVKTKTQVEIQADVEDVAIDTGNAVAFETDAFSVYAIVGTESYDHAVRVKYIFQNADGSGYTYKNTAGQTIDNQIIKNGESLENVGIPEIDAGGQTFNGWYIYQNGSLTGEKISFGSAITVTTGATATNITATRVDIADVDNEAKEDKTQPDYTIYVRPSFGPVHYITFWNEVDGQVIYSKIQVPKGATYNIANQQAVPPDAIRTVDEEGHEVIKYVTYAFTGWSETAGTTEAMQADNDLRTEITETTVTVNGDVKFYPIFRRSHWLSFYSAPTGSGATYIPPVYVLSGQPASSVEPADPTWEGHTFVGWFTEEDDNYLSIGETATEAFNFNSTLSTDITLYAHWNAGTANYTIVYWEQLVTDAKDATDINKNYEYGGQKNKTAQVTSVQYPGTVATIPTGFHINESKSDTSVTVLADGTAVLNVYLDRDLITMNFSGTQTTYTTANRGRYGLVNGSYVQLYYRKGNGWYYEVGNNDNHDTVYYSSGWNEYTQYTGTRYNQTSTTINTTYTGLYGQTLEQNEYTWPEGTWQYTDGGRTLGMSYLGQFVLPISGNTINFTSVGNDYKVVYFYLQNVDGTYPEDPSDTGYLENKNGTFYFSEKYDGFTVKQYKLNNGNWQAAAVDGSTSFNAGSILHIRYERLKYTVKFLDSRNGTELADVPAAELVYGGTLSSVKPSATNPEDITPPSSEYEWTGKWYSDQDCTAEFDWSQTMPNHDIAVYVNWNELWYWVKIDPDGGVLTDTESTWFWETKSALIEEYHDVTRQYVEDPEGTWYYHYDEFDPETETNQFGTTNERKAYYTQEASLSTDGNKPYKQDTRAYSLVGWYEVDIETGQLKGLYNFDAGVTGNTYLRAVWRIIGEYRVAYSVEGVNEDGTPLYAENEDGNTTTERVVGANAPTDINKYADKSNSAIGSAIGVEPTGYTFTGWYYNGKVYNPGDAFMIQAELDVTSLDTVEDKTITIYPVFVKYENLPVKTTHIYWYGNTVDSDGETIAAVATQGEPKDETTNANIQINENVDVMNITTLLNGSTAYNGYTFKGWAKQEEGATSATTPWLVWDGEKFTLNGETVTKVAADENEPYDKLVAVWEKKTYTVTVQKVVSSSLTTDQNTPFVFTPSFSATGLGVEYQRNFSLVGNEDGYTTPVDADGNGGTEYLNTKTFDNVPFGSTFSFNESTNDFTIEVTGSYVDDQGISHGLTNLSNGSTITVNGDMTIVFTNTRKMAKLNIVKTDGTAENAAPLDGAAFTLTTIAGPSYNLTTQNDGYGYAGTTKDLDVPMAQMCTLTETKAPDGYVMLDSTVRFKIEDSGIVFYDGPTADATPIKYAGVTASLLIDGTYTITVANTPGAALPHTGGIGTGVFVVSGLTLVLGAAAYIFLFRPSVRREERRER